tara:strand:+ start:176 stop:550 length:375 start_codon:yes stop_codon:yes gene_type:complete
MSDKAWKQRERKVADFFGGQRTPLSGGNGKITRADVIHDKLFIENKLRKKHSVISLWDETNEMAKEESKTPVITLAEKNRKGFWIMIHSSDLHKLEGYGKSKMEGSNIRKEEPKTDRSAQETDE